MGIVDRTPPTVRGNLGEYNKIIKVASTVVLEFSLIILLYSPRLPLTDGGVLSTIPIYSLLFWKFS